METFSALLAICVENSPVTGEFPAQRPVTGSFDIFFDLHLNKRSSKHWWGWWFETPSCPLWRHCNGAIWRSSVKLLMISDAVPKWRQCNTLWCHWLKGLRQRHVMLRGNPLSRWDRSVTAVYPFRSICSQKKIMLRSNSEGHLPRHDPIALHRFGPRHERFSGVVCDWHPAMKCYRMDKGNIIMAIQWHQDRFIKMQHAQIPDILHNCKYTK